ncbi:MAG: hemin uptake protein HemP [Ramlibacter sp.]|nr:hemin uptake protein HemP [Ramlibacter sp.]
MANHTVTAEASFGGAPPEDLTNEKREDEARVVKSESLLQGNRTVHITHNGSTYRLQATRLGKLILTK